MRKSLRRKRERLTLAEAEERKVVEEAVENVAEKPKKRGRKKKDE